MKTNTRIDDRTLPKLKSLLEKLLSRKDSLIFHEPVDYIRLNLSDYTTVIQRPMDLGTVKRNLEKRSYQFVEQCLADIQLTFDNCALYNGKESVYTKTAQKLDEYFKKQAETLFGQINVSGKEISLESVSENQKLVQKPQHIRTKGVPRPYGDFVS